MPLVLASLTQGLGAICDPSNPAFTGYPLDYATAQSAWGAAYDAYAAAAVDMGGNLLVAPPGGGGALFGNQLGFAQTLSAAASANCFDAALVAYWTGRTFGPTPLKPPAAGVGGTGVFTVVATSKVTAPLPGTLSTSLQRVFNVPLSGSTHASDQIAALAAALHAATVKIVVAMAGSDTTPSPSGPLAIVATGTLT